MEQYKLGKIGIIMVKLSVVFVLLSVVVAAGAAVIDDMNRVETVVSGTVIEKSYEPASYYFLFGGHGDRYRVKFEGEDETGKTRERTVTVDKEEYDKVVVGEQFKLQHIDA